MTILIEVPGEAAPLSPQQVYLALQSASSQQQNFIQTGTQQLQTWETQRGYYHLLQKAYLDKSLPIEIRHLAIIQFKNGIDKYWRKSSPNAIKQDEKTLIRLSLYEGGIGEADPQLALQNALAISKVVRIEYPTDWPEAITSLIAILRIAAESNQLHLRRGLLILLQITKELSTARLRRSQKSLQSVTPEIVFLLGGIYGQKVSFWLEFLGGAGDDEGGAIDAMDNSLIALKILRRLLVVGYEYPDHEKEVQEIWKQSQSQFGQLLDLGMREPPVVSPLAKTMVEKHLVQLAKLHCQMAGQHPGAFALLPNSLELTRAYWGLITKFGDIYGSSKPNFSAKALNRDDDMKSEISCMEKISLRGLLIFRSCIKMVFKPANSFKYRTPEIKDEQVQAVNVIKTQLLTDELVSQLADVIVTKFFVFRQADLTAWEEEPDEWEIREEGSANTWEFELRACSEKLFLDLVLNFNHMLKEPLLSFFRSVTVTSDTSVLTKDSVYTAMGLCAPIIRDHFDFDAFLKSTLVNDIQQSKPGYKVVRRRIAILIGSWVVVKIAEETRPLLYQIFQYLLNPQDEINDIVVRITATRQLERVVDDIYFTAEPFLPFAAEIIGLLMALIQEVEPTETKMAVLQTIKVICTRLDHHISPFADQIVSILPGLWDVSGDEHLMKQSILVLLSSLVASLKETSPRYSSLIVPLIQQAVVPNTDINVYLMEESLDLWHAIIQQAPTPAPPEIVSLAENTFPLLEIMSENLRIVLAIIESYILLAPETMLGDTIRLRTLSYMTVLLGTSKRQVTGLVTTIVERMIRAAESLGGAEGVGVVTKDLFESGYIEKVLEGLRDAWEAHQTVGPERRYPKLDDVVETDYFTVIARIALASPEIFMKLMSSVGPLDEAWSWLSTEWFRHFDSIANVDAKKLSCLGLTRLLELPPSTTSSITLSKLQDYFSMWTSVIIEMQDGRDDGGDNLIWMNPETERNQYETSEDVRRRVASATDPVHTVHTRSFVNERLRACMEAVGGEDEFHRLWTINVDKDVIEGFQMLSSGGGELMP